MGAAGRAPSPAALPEPGGRPAPALLRAPPLAGLPGRGSGSPLIGQLPPERAAKAGLRQRRRSGGRSAVAERVPGGSVPGPGPRPAGFPAPPGACATRLGLGRRPPSARGVTLGFPTPPR